MARRSALPGLTPVADDAVETSAPAPALAPPPAVEPALPPAVAVGQRVRYAEVRGTMLLDVVGRVLAVSGGTVTLQIPDNYGAPGEVITAGRYDARTRRGWWAA